MSRLSRLCPYWRRRSRHRDTFGQCPDCPDMDTGTPGRLAVFHKNGVNSGSFQRSNAARCGSESSYGRQGDALPACQTGQHGPPGAPWGPCLARPQPGVWGGAHRIRTLTVPPRPRRGRSVSTSTKETGDRGDADRRRRGAHSRRRGCRGPLRRFLLRRQSINSQNTPWPRPPIMIDNSHYASNNPAAPTRPRSPAPAVQRVTVLEGQTRKKARRGCVKERFCNPPAP